MTVIMQIFMHNDTHTHLLLCFVKIYKCHVLFYLQEAQNVFSARRFVNWYNGHPDYVNENINLDTEVAAVIGHGNVALDVARILLKSTDELKVI